MNYPTTVTNPLLKKHQQAGASPSKIDYGTNNNFSATMGSGAPVKFSNHERPVSCP